MDFTISEYFKKFLANEDDDSMPEVNSEKQLETAQENVDCRDSDPSISACTPGLFRCHDLGEYLANEDPDGLEEISVIDADHVGTDFALATSELQAVEEVKCSEPLISSDVNHCVYFNQQDELQQTRANLGQTDDGTLPNQHALLHIEQKPFTCSQCNKKYNRKSHLNRHILSHAREKTFVCTQCEQRFARKDHLTKHVKTHSRKELYSCNQCEETFVRKFAFNRHLLAHTGEKPFSCSQCGKGFSKNSDLKIHKRTHYRQKTLRTRFPCKF